MPTATILNFPLMTKSKDPWPDGERPNRIAPMRKAHNLTMQELADRVNLTRGHLGNLERGARELTMPVMVRIAEQFGCPAADLLTSSDGGLTPEERRLIDIYRQVPDYARAAIDAVALSQRSFIGSGEVLPLDETDGAREEACSGTPRKRA